MDSRMPKHCSPLHAFPRGLTTGEIGNQPCRPLWTEKTVSISDSINTCEAKGQSLNKWSAVSTSVWHPWQEWLSVKCLSLLFFSFVSSPSCATSHEKCLTFSGPFHLQIIRHIGSFMFSWPELLSNNSYADLILSSPLVVLRQNTVSSSISYLGAGILVIIINTLTGINWENVSQSHLLSEVTMSATVAYLSVVGMSLVTCWIRGPDPSTRKSCLCRAHQN